MKITTAILFASIFFLGMGCENTEKAARRRAQWEQNIELARLHVLEQSPDLDSASREMVRTNRPRILYVGLPFGGDYTFCWSITSNRVAELDALSSPQNVSKRPVKIRQLVPNRHY